ncbi:MAG TPA: hypothetical protein VGK87_16970 [Anaerolineae bacterium]
MSENRDEDAKSTVTFGRPSDRSLQAFKNFVNGMFAAITGVASAESDEDDMTEEEWLEEWKAFWNGAETEAED